MNLITPDENLENDISPSKSASSSPFANLVRYGLTDAVQQRIETIIVRDPELVPGRVARVDGISTLVHANATDYRASSTFARIAHSDDFEIEPAQPTVGDWVLIRKGEGSNPGEIELVLPRTSLLIRKRAQRGKYQGDEQGLAANVSTVFVIQAATYFNVGRLEREIALVWGSGATPIVVITKTDLLEEGTPESIVEQANASAPGVEVFAVSGITGEGTNSLRSYTQAGSTVALIGASGVGKSTLVNHLMGEEVMETGDIRETDTRGRHTTVTRQLLPLPGGGVLIDTPGIRSIALVSGSEEAIAKTFAEVEQYFGQCRFRDCQHQGETGCAIAEAIESGDLSQDRFDSYLRMGRELKYDQTKNTPRAKKEHERRMKVIAKAHRQRSRLEKRRK